jgi:GNAT superfamily N-acetyltransferase
MAFPGVEYSFLNDDEADDFDIEARIGVVRIGYAWATSEDDRLHLADIRVDEQAPEVKSLAGLRGRSFRGHGIGSELLKRVLHKADTSGIRETWGTVTKADLTPSLLRWYERNGFVIVDPDEECVGLDAAKKIVQRRSRGSDFSPAA